MYKHLHHQPMTADEIDILVKRIRDGDVMSMKYLVANNIKLVLSFIKGYGEYKYETMHDVLPYVMRAIEKYDSSKGSFSGYIKGAVRFGFRRRKDKREALKRNDVDGMYIQNTRIYYRPSPSPEEIMVNKEYRKSRKRAIREAMEGLSIRSGYLVRQHFLKGRTMHDLADEEGITAQRVSAVIQRAVKDMLPCVEQYKQDLR